MERMILFDIDGTIFDRDSFLHDFDDFLKNELKLTNEELKDIVEIYDEIKNEYGYFVYQAYLERIYKLIPSINKKCDYFFGQENLNNYLFNDSNILFSLNGFRLGIFSKGDNQFQKMKITKFSDILEEDLVYIFHNKIKKLLEVINANKGGKIYFIDDKIEVLISAKDVSPEVVTILIDRKNKIEKPNGIDYKLENLFDIIALLT